MLKLESRDDLLRLVDDQINESITLEYKASPALARQNRDEICKDVSAFANSTGGQIIYGITEVNQVPTSIDEGVSSDLISREWLEQIINSNIQPRISGITITPITVQDGRYAYVITIPPGTTAHQAPDKKYYRRFNFQSVAMHDYEIRDVMKRATTAEPFVSLAFKDGNEGRAPVHLFVSVGNRSPQPAFYSLVSLYVDANLEITDFAGYEDGPDLITSSGHRLQLLRKRVGIPEHLPIFQEANIRIDSRPPAFKYEFRIAKDEYLIRCIIQTPGYTKTEDWIVHRLGTRLTMEGPLPPIDK